jgi:hypothetical protein
MANKRLILWKFEDELKGLYQRIVVAGQVSGILLG